MTFKEKSPAFQFYPQDYLSSARVATMTLEEEGVYLRLLCYCWSIGSIPADPVECAKLAGKGCSVETATNVQRAFNVSSTNVQRMVHDRLEIERQKQQIRRQSCSKAGKQSASNRGAKSISKRTKNSRSTNVQRRVNSSSSSSDEDVCVSGEKVDVPVFEDFWNIYPRKIGKKAALRSFNSAIKNHDAKAIMNGVARFAKASKGTEKQYIPHPATWLNQGRWDDEVEDTDPKAMLYFNKHDISTLEGRAAIEREFLENLHK